MSYDALQIPYRVARQLVNHCITQLPNEGCGLLAMEDVGRVVEAFGTVNAWASPIRYALDPVEQTHVVVDILRRGWQLGGVFHSHIRAKAYPSLTDIRLASMDVPYVIVSLATRDSPIRAFRIQKGRWNDSHGIVIEVPIAITAGKQSALR